MLPRPTLSAFLLLAVIAGAISCGPTAVTDRLEYDFNEGAKHRRLVVNIPTGAVSEVHQRDEEGNLVRTFRYADGAEFYVACRDIALEPVVSIQRSTETTTKLVKSMGDQGNGIYQNGTHWRRQARDGFVIGYDFVDNKRLEEYDKALHSVRFTK
jgi:hypothetical protein